MKGQETNSRNFIIRLLSNKPLTNRQAMQTYLIHAECKNPTYPQFTCFIESRIKGYNRRDVLSKFRLQYQVVKFLNIDPIN